MFCVNCGAKIEDGCAFCPECGYKLEMKEPEEAASVVVSMSSERVLFCPNCGGKIENDIAFCPECGYRIVAEDSSSVTVQGSEQSTAVPERAIETSQPVTERVTGIPQPVTETVTESASGQTPAANALKSEEKQPSAAPQAENMAPKKKKNSLPAILIACIVLALLGAGGYGYYKLQTERNAIEASRIQAEREKEEAQERQAKQEKEAQEALEKQRAEALKKLTTVLGETIGTLANFDDTDLAAYSDFYAGFLQKKDEYESLTGMEDNIFQTGKSACDLIDDALDSNYALMDFHNKILDFAGKLDLYIELDPKAYSSWKDFFQVGDSYLEQVTDSYQKISCPAGFGEWWGELGTELELLDSLQLRGGQSLAYNDTLRYHSYLYLKEHITNKVMQRVEEYGNIYQKAIDFNISKINVATDIYREIMKASELPYEERQKYAFTDRGQDMMIQYDTIEVIYPTLYNAIDEFAILNLGCISGEKDVVVEFEIPGLTQVLRQSYHIGSELQTIYLKPPAALQPMDFSSVKDGQMRIDISDKAGGLIETHSVSVRIMSQYDFRWINDEFGYVSNNNILCFLTPEASSIEELKREAVDKISSMTGGKMKSFPGYQNTFGASQGKEYINTYLQAAGVMVAMSDQEIRYNMDTFSASGGAQHIMMPDDVIKYKSGLCIETSLVVASALQSAGLHTYILLPEGHAQVAVESWKGSGQYFLIETTILPNDASKFVEYINALIENKVDGYGRKYISSGYPIAYLSNNAWEEYIQEKNVTVIDCSDSILLGSTPFAK